MVVKTLYKSILLIIILSLYACNNNTEINKAKNKIDPVNELWYTHPAEKWEDALPVGNGRLGAMVFGKTDIGKIRYEARVKAFPENGTMKVDDVNLIINNVICG